MHSIYSSVNKRQPILTFQRLEQTVFGILLVTLPKQFEYEKVDLVNQLIFAALNGTSKSYRSACEGKQTWMPFIRLSLLN